MTDSPPPQEMPADRTTTVASPAADTPGESAAAVPPAKRPRRWPTLVLGALLGATLVPAGAWMAGTRQASRETPVVTALQSQLVAANAERDTLRRDLATLRSELTQTNERVAAAARAGEQAAADTARLIADLRAQVIGLAARLDAVPRTAAVDPAVVNKLDTAGHEFGHMLGVGDEYGTKGDKTSHWNLVKKAFGQQYADDVALKDVPGGGSIMRGGQEVRIYHYVTFWQALCESTLKAALPDPKFGYDDWKFNE